jgi:hypothetical protein
MQAATSCRGRTAWVAMGRDGFYLAFVHGCDPILANGCLLFCVALHRRNFCSDAAFDSSSEESRARHSLDIRRLAHSFAIVHYLLGHSGGAIHFSSFGIGLCIGASISSSSRWFNEPNAVSQIGVVALQSPEQCPLHTNHHSRDSLHRITLPRAMFPSSPSASRSSLLGWHNLSPAGR